MHNLLLSRFYVKLRIQCTSIHFIRFFYATWIKSFHWNYTVHFRLLRIYFKLKNDNDYVLNISRSLTPFVVLFHKLMGNIHMSLEMCKHIFFVDFFIMSFLIIYNDLQSKKAKGKPTGFWALGSRLCLNFPLFVGVIFKIFHMLKYFSFPHYYHSIFLRK